MMSFNRCTRGLASLSLGLALGIALLPVQAAEPRGLLAALQATRQHHPALAGKRAEVRASEYQLDATRAQRYPTVTAQLGQDDADRQLGTLRVKQPLWAFGKIDSAIARDEVAITVEALELQKIERDLLERTAEAYATIDGARARLAITAANIEAHQALHDHISSRADSRLASQADVTLSESRLILARTQYLQAQSDLQIAEDELLALTQVAVDSTQPIDPARLQLPERHTFETQVLQQHPELAYKRQQRALALEELSVERVSAYPTLSLQLDHTLSSSSALDDDASDRDTRVMLTLESTLNGLGFAARGRQLQAGARLTAAERDLEVTRNELRRRIQRLQTSRTLFNGLQEAREHSVAAYQATLDSYLRQYRAGKKSWLEVLNTRRELTEQQLQLAQAQNEWLRTSLSLAVISGRFDSPNTEVSYE